MRGRFGALMGRSKRQQRIVQKEEEPKEEGEFDDPRWAKVATFARSRDFKDGLLPLLSERIELLDDMMSAAVGDRALWEALGQRNELRKLRKQLRALSGDDDAR